MFRPSLLTVLSVLAVAVLGLMAVGIAQRARGGRSGTASAQAQAASVQPERRLALAQLDAHERAAVPAKPAATLPGKPVAPPAPKPVPTFAVAKVDPGHTVALRSKPGGRVLTSVSATTQFGSPTTLSVAKRHRGWLGVTSTDLPNGELGWVRAKDAPVRAHSTHVSIRIDLSRRKLELRRGRHVVRTATVGIGRPGSATPTGRFSITDKLSGSVYGPYYGCCILALSGHQVHTPAGWQGGDRLAIHGTDNPASIGVPSSAGCLHADAEDLKVLMRKVPLGTPVFISR